MSDDGIEVWASGSALMRLDSRVLEVFGFADVQRFHLAFAPRMRVGKRMVTISPEHGGQLSFFFDKEQRARLEEFAASVEAAIDAFDPQKPSNLQG